MREEFEIGGLMVQKDLWNIPRRECWKIKEHCQKKDGHLPRKDRATHEEHFLSGRMWKVNEVEMVRVGSERWREKGKSWKQENLFGTFSQPSFRRRALFLSPRWRVLVLDVLDVHLSVLVVIVPLLCVNWDCEVLFDSDCEFVVSQTVSLSLQT